MINVGPEGAAAGAQPAGVLPVQPERNRDPLDDPLVDTIDNPRAIIEETNWTLANAWFDVPWWCMLAATLVGVYFAWWLLLPAVLAWLFWDCATVRSYKYAGPFSVRHHSDLRPDANALLNLKHVPRYGIVEVRRWITCWGMELPLTSFAFDWFWGVGRLFISFEMVAQLCTDRNLSLAVDEKTAWLRILAAAQGLHTVNYDRFLSVDLINVKQDTCQYVLALYRRMIAEAVEDFPDPVSQQ